MKTNSGLIAILCLTITLTSACSTSNASKKRAEQLRFETRISASGLKHFEIRERQPHDTESEGVHQESRQRAVPRSRKSLARALKSLEKQATKVIADTQYCRRGFWVLDADSDHKGAYLRGECNDLASDSDRLNFPDSIKNW